MNEIRVRKCGPRVKTGCVTCKIRRVKCGEEKPYCRRCTSTGRKCDGYTTDPKAKGHCSFVCNETQFPPLFGDTQEIIVLENFCGRISTLISPFFELDNFWRSTVPQLAFSDSAVKNALVAITSVYDQAERNPGFLPLEHDTCAVQSYNEAIRILLQKDFSSPSDIFTSLVVCVLFICLESIRGNMKVALDHIQGGFKILQQHRTTLLQKSSRSPLSVPIGEEFVSELDTILSNLRIQTIVHDPTLLPPNLPSGTGYWIDRSSTPTLSEVRLRVMALSHEVTGLIIWVRNSVYTGNITLDQMICQKRVVEDLHYWVQYLDLYMARNGRSRASILVLMHTLIFYVWTANALTPGERGFDNFKAEFEQIVDLAEEIANKYGITHFQMDSGLIPPLHFTAAMCRYPLLRRRALKILGSAHWREGLFDSHRAYRVTHKVMEIEERGIEGDGSGGIVMGEDVLPNEEARIHSTQFDVVDHGARQQRHIFATKANGLFNDFAVTFEWIDFGGRLPAVPPPNVLGISGRRRSEGEGEGAFLTSGPTVHSAVNLQLLRSWTPG